MYTVLHNTSTHKQTQRGSTSSLARPFGQILVPLCCTPGARRVASPSGRNSGLVGHYPGRLFSEINSEEGITVLAASPAVSTLGLSRLLEVLTRVISPCLALLNVESCISPCLAPFKIGVLLILLHGCRNLSRSNDSPACAAASSPRPNPALFAFTCLRKQIQLIT